MKNNIGFEDVMKVNYNYVFTIQPARPVTFFGVGAIKKIDDIAKSLVERNLDNLIIVTDPTIWKATNVEQYIKPALVNNKIRYTIYDKVRPNPTYDSCDELATLAKETGAKALLSVGGGSHTDSAKTAAALVKYPQSNAKQLYEEIIMVNDAIPLICINTTHGTGSEVDNFAVAQSDGGYKPLIAGPALYPMYTIEDPTLTLTLPKKQIISTSLDAFNHSFEAATTKSRNPYSAMLSETAIRLVAKWIYVANLEPENVIPRYWLMYASILGGISFDIGLLHLTHALEHPISALNPKAVHGIGLTSIFPAVLNITYKVFPELSAKLLSPIIPELEGVVGEAEYAEKKIEQWFFDLGATEKLGDLGFKSSDLPKLVENAMTSPMSKILFNYAPVEVNENLVKTIFERSLSRR